MIRLAAWDRPLARYFFSPIRLEADYELSWHSPHDCERLLQRGRVDVALVPPLTIMRDPEPWEVIPDVGVASARYPHAHLVLRDGLDAIERIGFDPRHRQEVLLTQIFVREHYKQSPEFVPIKKAHPQEVLDREGAILIDDLEAVEIPEDGVVLNVGQEWFELVAYPATWGLLASKSDQLEIEEAQDLRDRLLGGEERREAWIEGHRLSEEAESYLRDDLFVRMEGAPEAGLVEMAQYLFYHGTLEEIPQIPFLIFPDEDEHESIEAHG